MSTVKRWGVWLLLDGPWWALAVLGVVYGVGWAANLFKFWTIVVTILLVFTAIVVTFAGDDIDAPPKHGAGKLSRFTDALVMLLLAAYGWFGYATLVAVQIVCSLLYRAALDRQREERQTTSDDIQGEPAP